MPMLFNGSSPRSVRYNGELVKRILLNGVEAWSEHRVTLMTAKSNSIVTLRSGPSSDASTHGSIPAGRPFFLLSTTATSGFKPILYNGGLWWITSTLPVVQHTITCYHNDIVALYNTSGIKTLYADRSERVVLKSLRDYPLFSLLESEPVDGFWHVLYGDLEGYITDSTYLQQTTDLGSFDLSNYWIS